MTKQITAEQYETVKNYNDAAIKMLMQLRSQFHYYIYDDPHASKSFARNISYIWAGVVSLCDEVLDNEANELTPEQVKEMEDYRDAANEMERRVDEVLSEENVNPQRLI